MGEPYLIVDPVPGYGTSVYNGTFRTLFRPGDPLEGIHLLLKQPTEIGCWDLRRLMDWPLTDEKVVWDVKSLHGGDMTLSAAVRRYLGSAHPFLGLDQRMTAHARASRTVGIRKPVVQTAPGEVRDAWAQARAEAIHQLFLAAQVASDERGMYGGDYGDRWPFIRAVREIELNGICVDEDYIIRTLNENPGIAASRALRSMQGNLRGGLVTALYNPMGVRTGRVRHEGGFNALGIPKGPARRAIVSRFEGGLICTFDFNAIDYRCIVRTVGGEVARLYEGAQDFHERTASFVFKAVTPVIRDAIKYVAYIYIYGGSEETCARQAGWTVEQVRKVTELLDRRIMPIKEFRERLWMQAQRDGYVDVPGGRRVQCQDGDGAGKVVGLFAQSYSSWVTEQALVRVQRFLRGKKSKVIFHVYDEFVVDMHPEEAELMPRVKELMEQGGNVVKFKKGRSYGEVE